MDCGVNLIDSKLKNVVLSNIDQTAFLQMLGRIRKTDFGINLYLQSYKFNSILVYHNRYTSALMNLAELHLVKHPVPDVDKYNLENFDANVPDSLKGARFPEKQLVSLSDAHKANEQLTENLAGTHLVDWIPIHQKGENYHFEPSVLTAGVLNVLYAIYCYRKAVVANAQEKDPFVFLKIQLGWLGKTYDATHWVNYDATKNELQSYLGELADSERLLYPEHQTEFVDRCLHYLISFPLIPEAIRLNYSRYKFANTIDSTYDEEETVREGTVRKPFCGKDKLNGVFWSEKIAFEIRSIRKYPKAHPSGITCWKLVRLSEEEMNKKAANRLHNKAVQSAKRDETIERKKEAALEAKRKAYEEEQKKKNSFTVALLKGDKVFATHRAQVDLNPSDIE